MLIGDIVSMNLTLLPHIPASESPRPSPSWDWSHGDLRVSADGRSLEHADGTGFLWLADTAWELLHRCTRAEISAYLELRAVQGFTVIQTVALAEMDGLRTPNAEGHLPFADLTALTPDERYWDLIDWTVAEAERRGLAVALLPTWGDKVTPHWGIGPRIFNPANADTYGRWLGARYATRRNVVWVLGGDRCPIIDSTGGDRERLDPMVVATYRAMALGLQAGDGGRHLLTYHPWGGESSSTHWHQESWLAFNAQQNGHAAFPDLWNRIAADRARVPAKPVIDLEPIYEDIPICFDLARNGWASAWHVRYYAWIQVLAGACGHTYGCNGVWQMYTPGRQAACDARLPWRESMQLPGAWDMGHLRALLLSRPFPSLVPCQDLIVGPAGSHERRIQAARAQDGSWAVVYASMGQPFNLDLSALTGTALRAWWYDPRTGTATWLGQVTRSAQVTFTPPGSGADQDWVLVVDDLARDYSTPGITHLTGGAP